MALGGIGGGLTALAGSFLNQSTDQQNALTIGEQTQDQAVAAQSDREKLANDTQTHVFQNIQEVAQNSAQVEDKLNDKWDQILLGGGGQ
ncbi:MAG: hypothetical protein ACYCW6_09995 [Candidatus Xenobia bacterium]